MDKLNELSKAGSSDPKASLESVLDCLRLTLEGPGIERLPISDAADSDPSRMTFLAKLADLQASTAYLTLVGSAALRLTAAETADNLAQKAKSDFGWFLAVHALLPIAIEGGGSPLISANPDLYGKWAADRVKRIDGNSDLEFSDYYLTDRAAMLAAANIARTNDSVSGTTLVANPTAADSVLAHNDLIVGVTLRNGQQILDPKRITFGSEFGDALKGGNQSDHLYGMAGSDTLNGNDGADYLEGGLGDDMLRGGKGADIYRIDKTSGRDTILDNVDDGGDGQGSIVDNGQTLFGDLTQDSVNRNIYRFTGNPALETNPLHRCRWSARQPAHR